MTVLRYLLPITAAAWLAVLCSACEKDKPTGPEETGWQFLGLQDYSVHEMDLAYPYLYVSAGSHGLFRKRINRADAGWEYLGLSHSDLVDTSWGPSTFSYVSDVLVLDDGDVLAGVVTHAPWFPGLYRSSDGGRTWQSSDTGIADTLCPYESNIVSLAVSKGEPEVCFAGTDGAVYKSSDSGMNWRRLRGYTCSGLGIDQLHVHARSCNVIWAVGETNRFEDYLITSRDGGLSWQGINLRDVVTGMIAIGQISLDPFDDNVVYAWARGGPIRTEDGGDTWHSVSFPWAPDGVGPITFDDMREGHFFARSGEIYESWDGGETAEALEGPHSSSIRDMEYDGRRRTLYIGTATGVYRYLGP